MDINRFGVAVGIVALFLAVPLTILGNILTPHVREWYSTTSSKRLQRRIAQIEATLSLAKTAWTFTQPEWAIRDTLDELRRSLHFFANTLCTLLMLAIIFWWHALESTLGVPHPGVALSLVFGLVLLIFAASRFVNHLEQRNYDRARDLHSNVGRRELNDETGETETDRQLAP